MRATTDIGAYWNPEALIVVISMNGESQHISSILILGRHHNIHRIVQHPALQGACKWI
jgi:hypothetical protein